MKIVHKDDTQQITFLDERYYFDEKSKAYYPSVSTVLDVYPRGYGFIQWLKDLGSNSDEVLRRAAEQGTNIHNGIEAFLNGAEIAWTDGEKDNYTLDEWLMILKFFDFYKTYKPETIAIEVSLASAELGIGGTLDYVCRIPQFPNDIWYIDWKSGNAIYKTNKIQASKYMQLWNSKMEEKITRLGCMHFKAMTRGADKTGKVIQGQGWKLEEIEDAEHMIKLFDHAHAIWKEENPNPQPKNITYPDRISIDMLKRDDVKGSIGAAGYTEASHTGTAGMPAPGVMKETK